MRSWLAWLAWRSASGVKGASWGARLRQGFGGQAGDLNDSVVRAERSDPAQREPPSPQAATAPKATERAQRDHVYRALRRCDRNGASWRSASVVKGA